MNKAKLKSYAPSARRDFIQAVSDRAHFYGLSESEIIPVEISGDVALIGGRPFPRTVATQRRRLEERVKREGFQQVMEAVAYTWFNRFLALRFMELHDYLEHGFRVLSNTGTNTVPEILDHASELDLPGLNKQKVIELKLDGSKDAELYRLLLVAQCNALHSAMPFLFEKIEDDTELLLPDNLLHSDSLIRMLVMEIEEEDWQEVEIIGWLYQFYISEKKDQVIGSVVKSEDIPSATQLFTPNWIVKYMVQNSLGRQWMATYPNSSLKAKMEYYIEPAEQTDEVNAQLATITPDSLDPEKLTLLDPASGSGHILVEAYDVFKEIYLERGYTNRDYPRLILEKNLFGLDIDDRAGQMACFALLMKARKDDRRILRSDNPIKMNVMAIQESSSIQVNNADWGEQSSAIRELAELFRFGKTFGSLIQVPNELATKLPKVENAVRHSIANGDLYNSKNAEDMLPLVEQAKILVGTYDCVVANPPYMGSKGMNLELKEFAKDAFPNSKSDLFAMFVERGFYWIGSTGYNSMVTMQSWMFLSSYEAMRERILASRTIITMAHLGARAFSEISGEVVQTTATVFKGRYLKGFKPVFIRLVEGQEREKDHALRNGQSRFDGIMQDDFNKIPSSPIAYWLNKKIIDSFSSGRLLGELVQVRGGMTTADNERFVKLWHEIDFATFSHPNFTLRSKWFPYNKGGEYRKWFGNRLWVVDWENNGEAIKETGRASVRSEELYFNEMVGWTDITSFSQLGVRYYGEGFLFDASGPAVFPNTKFNYSSVLGYLGSSIASIILQALNATLHVQAGNISALPWLDMPHEDCSIVNKNVVNLIDITRNDWDSYETSWDFSSLPILHKKYHQSTLKASYAELRSYWLTITQEMQQIEEENNNIFINAFGMQNELMPTVPFLEITLTCNPHYSYSGDKSEAEMEKLLLADTMKRLVCYAIGCMMGRYSLDQTGLVYANNGNIGFDQSKYQTFTADDDGIVPIMDMDWFPDDATSRFEDFLKVAWSPETLVENLKFVADNLSPKGGETPRETVRRYVSTQFYKDHLQTYKKRPIYWLFSSGKQRAFECLVYLHRYNEATLSRMRNEYVTPLQGKFSAQADYLSNEVSSASSTAERNRLQKQLDTLRKKQVELASFDELLRHYADQRIGLDLDEGVKANYGRFGSLLAEVKAVTGGSE